MDEDLDFLRYRREIEKHPFEVEALKTSIESNRASIDLANETKKHFEDSKSNTKTALAVSITLNVVTLIILGIQTFSSQKTEIQSSVPLELYQGKELIKLLKEDAQFRHEHRDSLKAELQKLNRILSLTYSNKLNDEKGDTKPTYKNEGVNQRNKLKK